MPQSGVLLDLWIMDLASHRFNFDTYLLCEEDADPKVHVVWSSFWMSKVTSIEEDAENHWIVTVTKFTVQSLA
jgi:hypothetical protein